MAKKQNYVRIQLFPYCENANGYGRPATAGTLNGRFYFKPVEINVKIGGLIKLGRRVERPRQNPEPNATCLATLDNKNSGPASNTPFLANNPHVTTPINSQVQQHTKRETPNSSDKASAPENLDFAHLSHKNMNASISREEAEYNVDDLMLAGVRNQIKMGSKPMGPLGEIALNTMNNVPNDLNNHSKQPYSQKNETNPLNDSGEILDLKNLSVNNDISVNDGVVKVPVYFIAFRSKVVSRSHAEMWVGLDSKVYFRDNGSSSGTFLNQMRLSPSGRRSRPHVINSGDIIQLGVDYQNNQREIFKCVIMKFIFSTNVVIRSKRNDERLNLAVKQLTTAMSATVSNSLSSTNDASSDCCICLGEIVLMQALFLASCSHIFHYRCVIPLLKAGVMFLCPLCRQATNLDSRCPSVSNGLDTDEESSGESNGHDLNEQTGDHDIGQKLQEPLDKNIPDVHGTTSTDENLKHLDIHQKADHSPGSDDIQKPISDRIDIPVKVVSNNNIPSMSGKHQTEKFSAIASPRPAQLQRLSENVSNFGENSRRNSYISDSDRGSIGGLHDRRRDDDYIATEECYNPYKNHINEKKFDNYFSSAPCHEDSPKILGIIRSGRKVPRNNSEHNDNNLKYENPRHKMRTRNDEYYYPTTYRRSCNDDYFPENVYVTQRVRKSYPSFSYGPTDVPHYRPDMQFYMFAPSPMDYYPYVPLHPDFYPNSCHMRHATIPKMGFRNAKMMDNEFPGDYLINNELSLHNNRKIFTPDMSPIVMSHRRRTEPEIIESTSENRKKAYIVEKRDAALSGSTHHRSKHMSLEQVSPRLGSLHISDPTSGSSSSRELSTPTHLDSHNRYSNEEHEGLDPDKLRFNSIHSRANPTHIPREKRLYDKNAHYRGPITKNSYNRDLCEKVINDGGGIYNKDIHDISLLCNNFQDTMSLKRRSHPYMLGHSNASAVNGYRYGINIEQDVQGYSSSGNNYGRKISQRFKFHPHLT